MMGGRGVLRVFAEKGKWRRAIWGVRYIICNETMVDVPRLLKVVRSCAVCDITISRCVYPPAPRLPNPPQTVRRGNGTEDLVITRNNSAEKNASKESK